jgi:dTDP-4-dehydrorhamnose reductase
MVRFLGRSDGIQVIAAARSEDTGRSFPKDLQVEYLDSIDAEDPACLAELFSEARPDVTVNCVGLVKQAAHSNEILASVPVNTLLPHRLAKLAEARRSRLVHVSTDCVFSGEKGNYRETDRPDSTDVYGLSKHLGEVGGSNAITLRTSMIGHELRGRLSLLEWFLAQKGAATGFTHAIFSGLPTVELARIVRDYVLTRPELNGLYNVSAEPISKYNLLRLIASEYGKAIEIVPDAKLVIDRSLDSSRFRAATGYRPPPWPELIAAMRAFG